MPYHSILFKTRQEGSKDKFIDKVIEIRNAKPDGETEAEYVAIDIALKQLIKDGYEARLPWKVTFCGDDGKEIIVIPKKLAA